MNRAIKRTLTTALSTFIFHIQAMYIVSDHSLINLLNFGGKQKRIPLGLQRTRQEILVWILAHEGQEMVGERKYA